MARQERPLHQGDDPVYAFAQQLRDLRGGAGRPPYRELAARAHFAATTLSEAAAGRRLPSLEVTLGYVRACGGDVEEWRRRWHAVAHATGRRTAANPIAEQDPSAGLAESDAAVISTPRPGHRTRRAMPATNCRSGPQPARQRSVQSAAAAALAAALLGIAVAGSAGPDRPPTQTDAPSSAPSIGDGTDPMLSGCAAQATTLAHEPVRDRHGVPYGFLELRYARRCHAAWARYVPDAEVPAQLVTISITRPRPAGMATFTLVVRDGPIYGDMLIITSGCVQAHASVTVNDTAVADAATRCTAEPV